MFNKNIEFKAPENYLKAGLEYPIPAKKNIPEWYKKLSHTLNRKTVKGCMPFLDALTAGYIIKTPFDFAIVHNQINPNDGKVSQNSFSSVNEVGNAARDLKIPFNDENHIHESFQMEGSPQLEKNSKMGFHKFVSPWIIKTPPGYSCLFVSPMNNKDDRFEVISGIVDTDTFNIPINFPLVMNSDKYKSMETIVKKGTPIVQVIPFKRDSWKMTVKSYTRQELDLNLVRIFSKFLNKYKTMFWSKKSWR
jgi:hypothetical protein